VVHQEKTEALAKDEVLILKIHQQFHFNKI